jgi:hypothetical protein
MSPSRKDFDAYWRSNPLAGMDPDAKPGEPAREAIDKLYGLFGAGDMNSQAMMDQAQADPRLQASSPAMKAGQFVGDAAQFVASPSGKVKAAQALPRRARGAVEMGRQATAGGLLSAVQGQDPTTGAVAGAAGVPVAGAAKGTAKWLGERAVPLVRSGIKPLWSDMSKQAGASVVGADKLADRLARFIIDNRITTGAKAEAIILDAERAIQRAVGDQATDAPMRAMRYLDRLEQSAAKQGLPAQDVATIRGAAQELLEGPHGMDVLWDVPGAPINTGILDAAGKPVMRPGPMVTNTTRVLRREMPANETLEVARGSSKWGNRKSWGEQKGASTEASKTVERADRDAIKRAVPESRPAFQRQGQAIQAKKVFTRGEFRQSNRDSLGMPTIIAGAAEMAAGKPPFMAMAAEFARRNQVRMGVWADRLSTAIQNNDVETAATILRKFGVGSAAQMGDR